VFISGQVAADALPSESAAVTSPLRSPASSPSVVGAGSKESAVQLVTASNASEASNLPMVRSRSYARIASVNRAPQRCTTLRIMAGYSGTPLPKKLGIRAKHSRQQRGPVQGLGCERTASRGRAVHGRLKRGTGCIGRLRVVAFWFVGDRRYDEGSPFGDLSENADKGEARRRTRARPHDTAPPFA
jgi:hypothetical protein